MENERPISAYESGMIYEDFMRKAFNTEDNTVPGVHCSIMQNLIDVESNASSYVSSLGSPKEQLEQVKKHLHRAFNKILSRKMPQDLHDHFELFESIIDDADNSEHLMSIIANGMNGIKDL